MANLTTERNTVELLVPGGFMTRSREAAAAIYQGGLVAQNSSGKAVPAAASAGYVTLGIAQESVTSGGTVTIKGGVFLLDNATGSGTVAVTDIGKTCYISDDHTVTITGGTGAIAAGIVAEVNSDGVAVKIG